MNIWWYKKGYNYFKIVSWQINLFTNVLLENLILKIINKMTDKKLNVNVEIIAKVEKLDIIMLHNIAEKVDTLMLLM